VAEGTIQAGETREIETYVRRLTGALHPLPPEERSAIASEIRSHLSDCAARGEGALGRALEGMGVPELLGRSYVEEYRLAGALDKGSPLRLLAIVLGLAARGLAGFFGGLGVLSLYLIGATFFLLAGAKFVEPANVGMWTAPGYFAFAILDAPPPASAHEVLGYWIVPLSVVLGVACLLGGTRLLHWIGRRILKKSGRRLTTA